MSRAFSGLMFLPSDAIKILSKPSHCFPSSPFPSDADVDIELGTECKPFLFPSAACHFRFQQISRYRRQDEVTQLCLTVSLNTQSSEAFLTDSVRAHEGDGVLTSSPRTL